MASEKAKCVNSGNMPINYSQKFSRRSTKIGIGTCRPAVVDFHDGADPARAVSWHAAGLVGRHSLEIA